ncbi:hypothetical protein, partial [Sphingomonas turrisvirgatae]|uniref:hypothetical protein n=1 Tax=Sphingomonas turrisvirgatae TaxID=1888892 RepID=UPI000A618C1C
GLARLPRNDRGRLHLPEHLVELTRTLATKRPRPPVAAIHRKVLAQLLMLAAIMIGFAWNRRAKPRTGGPLA